VHPFELREPALALSELPARALATELATVPTLACYSLTESLPPSMCLYIRNSFAFSMNESGD
jgi:hypothetical protein